MSFEEGLNRTYYIYDNKVLERITGKQFCASEKGTIDDYCSCMHMYGKKCEEKKRYKIVIKEYQKIDSNYFGKETYGYEIYQLLENQKGKIIFKR